MSRVFWAGVIGIIAVEIASSLMLKVPWFVSGLMGALFAIFAFWYARRGTRAALIVLAVLFFLELINVPFYERPDTTALVVELIGGVFAAVGLIGSVGLLLHARKESRETAAAS
jgi:hypothetical protein